MKLLVVLSRIPYPLEKGDKLRSFHQIRCLSKNNDIYLFCLTHRKTDPAVFDFLSPYCKKVKIIYINHWERTWNTVLAFLKGKPLQIGFFFSKKAKHQYDVFEKEVQPNHVYCQFVRTAALVKDSKVRKTIDYQDALSKNMERRRKKAPLYLRPILWYEEKALARYESLVFDDFNTHTIISEADRKWIRHSEREKIFVIPNGVDHDFFYPILDMEKKYDIVFTGNMQYPPNVDAAHFLITKIMPLLWENNPHYTVLIAGANPHYRLRKLSSHHVIISGWVDDIRKCYASAKVFVAPMQIGSGLQNKLLEAMSMQMPCITSALVNEALKAKEGTEVLLAQTAEEYAKNILLLLSDHAYAQQISLNGFDFVTRYYNWDVFTEKLNQILHL